MISSPQWKKKEGQDLVRIVLDLQGAQSVSRFRGIGRYTLSLALAVARNRGEHEIIIALNGLLPDTIEPIRAAFGDLLPQENIRVWYAPGPVSACEPGNTWRREAAERVREAYLAGLRPDAVHVSSLFEGLDDNALTSIGKLSRKITTAVTLYDLIPLINPIPYLENPVVKSWYLHKIDQLKRADILLAISESSRREGITRLGFPMERVFNVSSASDDRFRKIKISEEKFKALSNRLGIQRPFIMYTGGIDHRKNIEGLIRAFAALPLPLRRQFQLLIVCSILSHSRKSLETLAHRNGLSEGEMILTGFVSDEDLVALYNRCRLFVFPSWHEGFGLPVLEAMSCGAPVIGANTSSLPEVIGLEEAMFDPYSVESIAAKMEDVLGDEKLRSRLIRHGQTQVEKFTWDKSAIRALAALEKVSAMHKRKGALSGHGARRPRLAYVSPLPPERTGIAYYSAELLPELSRYYEIEVVIAQKSIDLGSMNGCFPIRTIDWFERHADCYERIIYHIGNSEFHAHMFGLLERISGVVVLHDFYLSGILAHLETKGPQPGTWSRALYESHGYGALAERHRAKDMAEVIWRYPCNLGVLRESMGVIVHSRFSCRLAEKWYGEGFSAGWAVIPHLRVVRKGFDRERIRRKLGLRQDDYVVCSFGLLGPTKLNDRLLHAWLGSRLSQDSRCILIFVGENHGGEYGERLKETLHKSGLEKRVRITGWVDMPEFQKYLAASDLAVQLRSRSRGETSGTVLDCMSYGTPTIVNAHGSAAELPDEAVWKLPDDFTDSQLVDALEVLWEDVGHRNVLGEKAIENIRKNHAPDFSAARYFESVERYYAESGVSPRSLVRSIAHIDEGQPDDSDLMTLAASISQNRGPLKGSRRLFLDISELLKGDGKSHTRRALMSALESLLSKPPAGYRVEPVYEMTDHAGYRHACNFTSIFLGCPEGWQEDELIEPQSGDLFLGFDPAREGPSERKDYLLMLRRNGVRIHFLAHDALGGKFPQLLPPDVSAMFKK